MPKRKRKPVPASYAPARRLNLVRAMLNTPDGASVYDIADRFRVSVRTAKRYLAALHADEEPLADEFDGKRKVWRLQTTSRSATITLSTSQMIALYLSRRVFDFLAGTGFKEDLDDVFAKLEKTLKRKDFLAARHLDRKFHDINEAPHIYDDRLDDVNDIVTALLNEERLRVRHASVKEATLDFVIEPLTLLVYKKGLYVVANSLHHNAQRTFALDGFQSIDRLRNDHFPYPPNHDPSRVAEGAFGLIGGKPERVRIFFDKSVEHIIRRRRWHPAQSIKPVDGGIELSITVATQGELRSWILSFGEKARVLSPAMLRHAVTNELRTAVSNYGTTNYGELRNYGTTNSIANYAVNSFLGESPT